MTVGSVLYVNPKEHIWAGDRIMYSSQKAKGGHTCNTEPRCPNHIFPCSRLPSVERSM